MSPRQFACVLGPYLGGELSLRGVRVFLAALEMRAIRDAARRSGRQGSADRTHYRVEEIVRLTGGLPERAVRRELRRLSRLQVLTWNGGALEVHDGSGDGSSDLAVELACRRSTARPIPVPRPLLRHLARTTKRSVMLTAIAYVVRGLSLERHSGAVRGRGTVKLSWVETVFRLSERATKYARAELVQLGLIGRDTGSRQLKLNRDGAYFELNLSWGGGARVRSTPTVRRSRSAPLVRKTGPRFAPPYERPGNYFVVKNQKASGRPERPAGVSSKRGREGEPTIRDVTVSDLQQFSRTEALYRQAVQAGMVTHSEASFLNWVAAAVRAKTGRARDPVRVFMGIVRRGLWHHLTSADEERARTAIAKYRAPLPPAVATFVASAAGGSNWQRRTSPTQTPPRHLVEERSPGAGRTGQGGTVGRRDPRSG